MPIKAINYANTIIYKIVSKDLAILETYVGHTTGFKDRKRQHKNNCQNENNKGYNLKVYAFIRANGGWNNFDMIELEKFSCNDTNEARSRERYWYETLNATLNIIRPIVSIQEAKEYKKRYEQTADRKEYERQRNQTAHRKEYERQRNKTTDRKESKSNWEKQTFVCECGCEVKNGSKSKHIKTKKHLEPIQ